MSENNHAAVLHAIADHIAAHPQLCPATITYANSYTPQPAELHVCGKWRNELTELAEWARSLDCAELTVRRCGGVDLAGRTAGAVHLRGTVQIAGHDIKFWGAVPALDHSSLDDGAHVTVREMFQVAADTAAELAAGEVLAGEPA